MLDLGPASIGLAVAGVTAIVTGYLLLARGSITAAPILLTLGYVVLLPAALLVGFGRRSREGA